MKNTKDSPANTAGIVSDRRGFDSRTPDQPVAWVFPMRCGFGVQFQRPADYTDEGGNLVQPQPLYSADALAALRAERDRLARDLADPPGDVQEAVLRKLGIMDYYTLKADLAATRAALDAARPAIHCEVLHHAKADRHPYGTTCPVEMRILKMIDASPRRPRHES